MFYVNSSGGSEPLGMSKSDILRGIITEKLSTAAREILAVVERTVADYEEEASDLRRQLGLLQPQVRARQRAGVTGSQGLRWYCSEDTDDDECEGQRAPGSHNKDPDYDSQPRSAPPSAQQVKRRPGRPRLGDVQDSLNLKIRLLEDSKVEVLTNSVLKRIPVFDLDFKLGLQEADFLHLLRCTFPQLGAGRRFDLFITDRSRRLQPLVVEPLTAEEICRAIRSLGHSSLYIRLKEEAAEGDTDPPAKEHLPVQTEDAPTCSSPSRSVDMDDLVSVTPLEPNEAMSEEESSSGEDETLDEDWKPKYHQLERRSSRKREKSDGTCGEARLSTSSAPAEGEQKTADLEPQGNLAGSKEAKMSCIACGVWYRLMGSLIVHAWTHVGDQRLLCGVCGQTCESAEALKAHLLRHKKVYHCSFCGKCFISQHMFRSHTARHTGEQRFRCDICDKSFAYKSVLNSHRWTHAGNKPHRCDICLKSFGWKSQLTAHKKIHGSKEVHRCVVCGTSLSDRRSLTRHMMRHSEERPHSCEVCGKTFKLLITLASHKKTHMEQERPFLCHVCCKAFPSQRRLNVHLLSHSGERSFICPVCTKGFVFKGDLTKHMTVHSDEAPFRCSECGRRFKRKTNLDSHLRIHAGVKKFVCGVCGKAVSRRDHLTVHMRTHNGEKPYKCTLCESAFTQSHCLKTHMKTHQRDGNVAPPAEK